MKHSNSDTKIKVQFSKYQNFFTEKNWDKEMYMDDRQAERPDLAMRMPTNKSLKQIMPRSKIAMSLHEKAGAILSNSNKMGIIDKKMDLKSKKSLTKIGYMSTLPPIRKQEQQTDEQLRRVKQEVNQIVSKQIKLAKQVSSMESALKQIKLSNRALGGEQKTDVIKQVENKIDQNGTLKYNFDVLKQMKQNLKAEMIFYAKRKSNTEQILSELKKQFSFAETKLTQEKQMVNKKLANKKVFENRQRITNEEILMKAQLAESKIKQVSKVTKVHNKLQNIEAYEQQQFKEEMNLQEHNKILTQLRVQQALSGMMDTLFNRDQTTWQIQEKCFSLIVMHAHLDNPLEKIDKMTTQVGFSETSQAKNNFSTTFNLNKKIDLVSVYNGTFANKEDLQQSIIDKEKQVLELEEKNKKLKTKWVNLMFSLGDEEKSHMNENKKQQSQRILERVKKAESHQFILDEIKYWTKHHEQSLDLKLSKKIVIAERLKKVLEQLKAEAKNMGNKNNTK